MHHLLLAQITNLNSGSWLYDSLIHVQSNTLGVEWIGPHTTTLIIAFVTLNWWINVIVAPSIFVLRRLILSAIRRKRASSSFGGAVILVSGVEKFVTAQEDLLVLSLSFPPTTSNLLYLLVNLSKCF